MRRKRQDAEKVYAAALQAKEEARAAALTADSEVVGLEAECAHCRAEVQAGQVCAVLWADARMPVPCSIHAAGMDAWQADSGPKPWLQAANTTLHADLDAQKEELAGITTTADLARHVT